MSDFDLDPRLAAFVDAARTLPPREPRVDLKVIAAAAQERRVGRRRTVIASTTTGLVAAAAMLLALRPGATGVGEAPSLRDASSPSGVSSVADGVPGEPMADATATQAAVRGPEGLLIGTEPPPSRASGLSVVGAHPVPVDQPGAIRLGDGDFHLALASAAPERPVELDGGSLWLEPGAEVDIEVRGRDLVVHVARGVAAFHSANDGIVVLITDSYTRVADDGELDEAEATLSEPERGGPSAGDLAREAELALASGDRKTAMKLLRKIAIHHRRSPEARAALLDLGRLLEKSGSTDEARCAYGLYLDRWPSDALASTVRDRRDALGEGPECKGMRPQIELP